jgi:signal transduction histidine kinase
MYDELIWNVVWVSHVIASVLMSALAVYVAQNHFQKPLGRVFVLMIVASTIWIVGSLLRLLTLDPTTYVFLTAVKYVGVTTAPVWFLLFALRYAGQERWITPWTLVLLFVGPVVTVLVILTTEVHGLFYTDFVVVSVGEATVLSRSRGAWFWMFATFGWALLAIGTAILLLTAIDQSSIYRKQSIVICVGILAPWIAGIAYIFADWPHPTIDPTPLGFGITALLFVVGVFSTRLIDVVPVARSRLVDMLDDAVIVADADGRLLDANATAQRLFLDGNPVGAHLKEVLPPALAVDGGEHVVETDDGPRIFRPRTIELTDGLGQMTGQVRYLSDVTDVIERERRSVLQRVFRHNIRNDLNVTVGHLDILADRVSPAEREHVERARESARHVIGLSEKARQFERALDHQGELTTVSAAAVAERVVDDARRKHPHASIALEVKPEPTVDTDVTVVGREIFTTTLSNLVENAVVHSETGQPSVSVRIEPVDDVVRLCVVDDGPGIPEEELAALGSTMETSLEHGSGFGLWLVKWTASLSAGELSFAENEPRGSVVTITLPAAGGSDE